MCGCEPGFTCTRCQGTPADPFYLDDEPAPVELEGKEDESDG
jgi:hypothetical protein